MPLFFLPKNSKSNDPGKVSQKRSNKKNREPTEKKKKTCGENCSCHSTVRLRRSPKHTLRHQPAWQSLYHGEGANFKRPTLSHAAIGFGFSWFSFCPIHCGWKLVAKVVKIWNISLIYSVPTNFDHFPSKFSPTVPVILSLPLSCWTFPVVVVIAGKAKVFLLLQAKKNQVKKCHHLFVPHKFFLGLQRKKRKKSTWKSRKIKPMYTYEDIESSSIRTRFDCHWWLSAKIWSSRGKVVLHGKSWQVRAEIQVTSKFVPCATRQAVQYDWEL